MFQKVISTIKGFAAARRCFAFVIALIVTLLLQTSCGISMSERNLSNLKQLEKGMTKQQVLKVMGEPLRNEIYNTDDVWYYFTESKWSDGACTRDVCSPLFFNRGLLLGWGE